ncbi:MAG: sigma-54 dependent transcriptional regulator [Proteobacteria bacterium]|nr:sigma-54 dependent transcriptional regulator [Pseudomonadota bacterium]
MAKPRILIVDDEPDLVELIELTLSRMDLTSAAAYTLADARKQLQSGSFELCLCDMRLPDGDGLDLLEWAQTHKPTLPLAIITAHGNVETAVRALKGGAFDFVSKPLDLGVLRRLVMRALKISDAPSANSATLRGPLLLGDSAPMQQLRSMIARVGRSQAPVHIAGESGTGKELVARLIHQSGPRAEGPFTAVNCGAIPSELMESEFFGHKRGSFTGAVSDSRGLLQSSEGGTLFLDEVADLPLHMQVKLLRVIQEKSVRPIGESQEVPLDIRVLSATHRDLRALVAEGRFREDLYYRINVIELKVPALRERPGDIRELAEHLLERLAQRAGTTTPLLTTAALQALQAHGFPGNVRELENSLERAFTLSDGQQIDTGDLQLRTDGSEDDDGGDDLDDQLSSVERDAIVRALQQSRYNKTAAAKLLGISFRTLRYRIKKLGIE